MSSNSLFRGRLVRLAAPRAADAETLSRWSEDGEFGRAADSEPPRPLSLERWQELERELAGRTDQIQFRVRALDDDRLLGYVAVTEIEWANHSGWLAIGLGEPRDRGKGYGADALCLLLRYAFDELAFHRLSLSVFSDNTAALRLYQKLGFQAEGRQREAVIRDGGTADIVLMGLLEDEWRQLQQGPDDA